jgi:hypothetical protein
MKKEPDFKTGYARLKAKRDSLRNTTRNPRPAKTPLSVSFSRRSKARKPEVA